MRRVFCCRRANCVVAACSSHALTHSGSVVMSTTTSSCSSSCSLSAVATSRRTFWNPFASKDKVAKAVSKLSTDQIQHNEALIDASLGILKLNTSLKDLTSEEHDAINDVVSILLSDFSKRPSAQFDVVYRAVLIEREHECPELHDHLFIVLHSILPEQLYALFVDVPELSSLQKQDNILLVRRFVHFLLGDVDLFDADIVEIDVEQVFCEMKTKLPFLREASAFKTLHDNADTLVLRARLFALLGDLCASFDSNHTGKISLKEFQDCVERVLGVEEAKQLLVGVNPDGNGEINYHQLTASVLRPRRGNGGGGGGK